MTRLGLSPAVLKAIKKDTELQGKIASTLGVSIVSLYRVLKNNDVKLTGFETLNVIKEYLGVSEQKDLLKPVIRKRRQLS